MHYQFGSARETSESLPCGEDFTVLAQGYSVNANLVLGANEENLHTIDGCVDDAETITDDLRPEATAITDLYHNLGREYKDGHSYVRSETLVLEADTVKATATVSNFSVLDALNSRIEACILEDQENPVLDSSCNNSSNQAKQSSIGQTQPFGRDGSISGRYSNNIRTRCKMGGSGSLERKSASKRQFSRRRNSSSSGTAPIIGFEVSESLDTRVEPPSFSDVCHNVDVCGTRLRSVGGSSGQSEDTILSTSRSCGAITSRTDATSSAEPSIVSGSTDIAHSYHRPAYSFSLPHHRIRHQRPIRVRIVRRPRKILILGDMMSGKSNLISAYCKDRYKEDYTPTILNCLQTDADVMGEKINLVVVEISGRDDFRPLRRCAYHKMDAAIICYPVDCPDSLERVCNYWVPELRRHAPKAPFVVVGTKRDIRDEARDRVEDHKRSLRGKEKEVEMAGRLSAEAAFVKEFVSYDKGKRVSCDLGATAFYECCSVYRDGTRKVFEGVAKIALQKSRRKRKMGSRHVESMCTII